MQILFLVYLVPSFAQRFNRPPVGHFSERARQAMTAPKSRFRRLRLPLAEVEITRWRLKIT